MPTLVNSAKSSSHSSKSELMGKNNGHAGINATGPGSAEWLSDRPGIQKAISKGHGALAYRIDDDYSNTILGDRIGTFTQEGGTFLATGAIETSADLDVFKFNYSGGGKTWTISLNSMNFDGSFYICDSSGNEIQPRTGGDGDYKLAESAQLYLSGGTDYYVVISSVGSIGSYELSFM